MATCPASVSGCRCSALLSLAEQHELSSAVHDAGLGLGAVPAPLMDDLLAAMRKSETVIERSLGTHTRVNRHAPA